MILFLRDNFIPVSGIGNVSVLNIQYIQNIQNKTIDLVLRPNIQNIYGIKRKTKLAEHKNAEIKFFRTALPSILIKPK